MPETVKKRLTQNQIEVVSSRIACLKDKNLQQRAFVSQLAAEMFCVYLEENGIDVRQDNSLYPVVPVLEHFDHTSITVKNNIIIDIRAVATDTYPQICIPSEHVLQKIQPDIYVGAKIDKKLENIEFIGFVKVNGLSCQKGNRRYYVIDAEDMSPINTIGEAISSLEKPDRKFLALDHHKVSGLLLPFLDGTASENEKKLIIQHLLDCAECRGELINLHNIDNSLKQVKSKLLLEDDYSLRLYSGDPLFEGKEAQIEFLNDEGEEPEKIEDEEEEIETEPAEPAKEAVFLNDEEDEDDEEAEEASLDIDSEEKPDEEIEPVKPTKEVVFINDEEEIEEAATELNAENAAPALKEESTEPSKLENVELTSKEPINDEVEEVIESVNPEKPAEDEPVVHEEAAQAEEAVSSADLPEVKEQQQDAPAKESQELPQKKTKRYIDWADQLVNNRNIVEKPLLSEDYIPKQELNEFFDSSDLEKELINGLDLSKQDALAEHISLDESVFSKGEKSGHAMPGDRPNIQPQTKETPTIKPSSETASDQNTEAGEEQEEIKQKEPAPQSKDEEVDNILVSLEDVETINEEDDIESLFAFFGQDEAPQPISEKQANTPPPVENVKPIEKTPDVENIGTRDTDDSTQSKNIIRKDGEYDTVLSGGGKNLETEEDINIFLYEEGKSNIEVINQEELMDIFNSEDSEKETASKKTRRLNLSLRSLFKDRNIVAFTVAISLSTTVLFLYLGQINQQVNVLGTDVVKKPEKIQESASSTENLIKQRQEQKREPMLSYTREVVRTIQYEPEEETPESLLKKALERNKVVEQEDEQEEKVVEIRNVSWELSASVASEPKLKGYFLEAGYTLKSRLAEELYIPNMENNGAIITIYAELDKDGNILKADVVNSSGSEEIDRRCVKAFRSTIQPGALPKVNLNKDKIKLNLIISI